MGYIIQERINPLTTIFLNRDGEMDIRKGTTVIKKRIEPVDSTNIVFGMKKALDTIRANKICPGCNSSTHMPNSHHVSKNGLIL